MAGQATAAGPRLGGADGEAGHRAHVDRAFNLAFRVTGSESHAADATLEAFSEAHVPPSAPGGPDAALQLIGATYDAAVTRGRDAEGPQGDRERPGVPAANGRLPPRDRAVLALQALYGLSYDQIARVMGVRPGEVGFLIAAAWIELDDHLSGIHRVAEPGVSEDCEQALALMAERDDGELRSDSDDGGWLVDHLARCGECRAALDAMQRARLAYSAWEPVATPPALFAETRGDKAEPPGGMDLELPQGPATVAPQSEAQRRRRRDALLAAGWAAALLLGVLAVLSGGVFSDAEGEDELSEASPEPPAAPRAPDAAASPAPRGRPERRPEEAAAPAPVVQPVPRVPVVVVPPPATRRGPQTPRPPPRRQAVRPRANPPEPTPRQQGPRQPGPEAGEETPTGPAPPQPPAAGCKDPAGTPVPC